MKRAINILIIILVVFGIGYVVYSSFISNAPSQSGVTATGFLDNPSLVQGREFLAALSNLKSLKLDDKIFSSPDFLSLQDFTSVIEPQPKGRINPFAPVGQEGSSASVGINATSTTQNGSKR